MLCKRLTSFSNEIEDLDLNAEDVVDHEHAYVRIIMAHENKYKHTAI